MADAVIGSLPQGLSIDEREKIFASTPLSPALNLLSSMPMVSNGMLLASSICAFNILFCCITALDMQH